MGITENLGRLHGMSISLVQYLLITEVIPDVKNKFFFIHASPPFIYWYSHKTQKCLFIMFKRVDSMNWDKCMRHSNCKTCSDYRYCKDDVVKKKPKKKKGRKKK